MARINSNIPVGPDYYKMEIIAPDIVLSGHPGQFVHVKISAHNSYDPLLRRPLSINDIDRQKGLLSLIYRISGRGTELMSGLGENTEIDLLGPLGKGFKTDFKNKNILVVGGGMGIAPLYYLVKVLVKNNDVTVLFGGNSKEELNYFYKQFNRLSLNIKVATMDGSEGYQGSVIKLWEDIISKEPETGIYDFVYSCGPEIMLKKVQNLAKKINIPGQISLERRMGCGIGVCLSCVCKTKNGNQRVCHDGPVFSLSEVILDD